MNKMKEYRERAGLTQQQVAARLGGVAAAMVNRYENADPDPSLDQSREFIALLKERGIKAKLDEVFPPKKPVKRKPSRGEEAAQCA